MVYNYSVIKSDTKNPLLKGAKYHLKIQFNNQVFECDTNDLASAIVSFAPTVLKTKTIFTITKDGKLCERQVFVRKMRMIFKNKMWRDTFIKQLIFK